MKINNTKNVVVVLNFPWLFLIFYVTPMLFFSHNGSVTVLPIDNAGLETLMNMFGGLGTGTPSHALNGKYYFLFPLYALFLCTSTY